MSSLLVEYSGSSDEELDDSDDFGKRSNEDQDTCKTGNDYYQNNEEQSAVNFFNIPVRSSDDSKKREQDDGSPSTSSEAASKRQKTSLPPIPTGILDMYEPKIPENTPKDDPKKHGGRVRTFKHERGSWATYIYIPVTHQTLFRELALKLQESVQDVDFVPVDHFHLSVSRTVTIRHHWIDTFMDELKKKAGSLPKFSCSYGPLKIYHNDDRTRSFLSLEVYCKKKLQEVVKLADLVLYQFHLPQFYDEPDFHVSLLSAAGDASGKLSPQVLSMDTLKKLQPIVDDFFSSHEKASFFSVSELQCKTGNKLYRFPFKKTIY